MDVETNQEEVKAEEKPVEETKEESKPAATPVVLLVDLHCVGCSKKVERVLMKVRGVEAISMDMGLNQVTIKGVVNPQALCNVIEKKTKKRASILSPSPPAEGEPTPQLVNSLVSGVNTIELNVNINCEGCARELKKKILKMRGVITVETDLGSRMVSVMGIMDAQQLVDYIYKTTKKHASIIHKSEPEPEPEPKKEEEEKNEEGSNESESKGDGQYQEVEEVREDQMADEAEEGYRTMYNEVEEEKEDQMANKVEEDYQRNYNELEEEKEDQMANKVEEDYQRNYNELEEVKEDQMANKVEEDYQRNYNELEEEKEDQMAKKVEEDYQRGSVMSWRK
ncbi:hypothetical protein Syun_020015 [Stephania yunnanensis]|uniref:HMA domain-containing protein n=1 Tax=Stephania yunnanensis TaxID=152371 RepID=A0AAP0IV85_9MAGN